VFLLECGGSDAALAQGVEKQTDDCHEASVLSGILSCLNAHSNESGVEPPQSKAGRRRGPPAPVVSPQRNNGASPAELPRTTQLRHCRFSVAPLPAFSIPSRQF